jgi:hypothetical protein
MKKITYSLVHRRSFLPECSGMTIVDVYSGIEAM